MRPSLSSLLLLNTTDPPGGTFTPRISQGYGNWSEAYGKARAFVCNLTLTEKVNFTTGHGMAGYGLATYPLGNVPRIGFSGYAMDDGPAGVRGAQYTSAFPAGLNLAMSWDRELMYLMSVANGAEHKDKGYHAELGPVVGPLGRVATGGRNFESFSPDPYLSGIAFGEAIAGTQAGGTIAVGKHYILYEQEHFREVRESNDWGTGTFNITEPYSVKCDDRTFHELYLFPWYDAVYEGMAGVMCSYNQINGTQACQNDHIMNEVLKGELGFQGFVTSDDGSQHSGIASALAGMDVTAPGETSVSGIDGYGISFWGPNLTLSVLNGSIPEWRLDDMVTRVMAAYYYMGDDVGFPVLNNISRTADVRGDHADIIRRVGANSVILLKNINNTLPLKKPRQLAIIGEDAGPSPYGPNGCKDRACNNGTLAMGWGSGSSNFPYLITPLEAIQSRALRDRTIVQYVLDNYAKDQIDTVAGQASACLVFVNSDGGEGYLEVDSNFGDRNNLTAWANGDELVKQVAANCSNTIVTIHAVGPILMEEWINHPNVTAVLFAGLPGQESGNSLVDVLYGDVNPSGKLPWTVAKKREDYGTDVLYTPNREVPEIDFKEGLFIDYRQFDKANITPRFEFGYGLSYTTFSYSDLEIDILNASATSTNASVPARSGSFNATITSNASSPQTAFNPAICPSRSLNPADYYFPSTITSRPNFIYPYLNANVTYTSNPSAPSSSIAAYPANAQGGPAALHQVLYRVSFTLRNNGTTAGQEVSQLYLNLGNGEPMRQLRGFNKTSLKAGEERKVTFDLRMRDVAIWDVETQQWKEVTGMGTTVQVYVGASSRDLRLEGDIRASRGARAGTGTVSTTAAPFVMTKNLKGTSQEAYSWTLKPTATPT